MKSKKLATLGLTAVLPLGLLTACSGGSNDTSETPVGSTPSVTESGVPAADNSANWTSVADLEDAKIAAQEGTTGNDVALTIPDVEVSAFKAVAQCGTGLIDGRVDCVIVDTHPAQSLVDASPDRLMALDFPASKEAETYVITTRKNDMDIALAEEFDTTMATLQENDIFDTLMDKYISKNEGVQPSELKVVESPKDALVIGANCEFESFRYLDENGDPTGFDVSFAQHLYIEMGYILAIEDMDFNALVLTPQSGRIDFIVASLTWDEERERDANFTNGYHETIQSIMVAKPAA